MQPMNPDPGHDGDPYDDLILDEFEASVEQQTPAGTYETDPLHHMLDAVEGLVEPAPAHPDELMAEPVHDPLRDILEELEADIESQVIPPEASGFEPKPEPVHEEFGSFENEPPLPGNGEHPIREYPPAPGLSKGSQGTGCRSLDSGGMSMGWCQLHGKLVSFVDCEECDDDTGGSECEYWSDAE